MTLIHTFLEGFCCFIPCPLGLLLLAIPPFVLTLRRRKMANAAKHSSGELLATGAQEAGRAVVQAEQGCEELKQRTGW